MNLYVCFGGEELCLQFGGKRCVMYNSVFSVLL